MVFIKFFVDQNFGNIHTFFVGHNSGGIHQVHCVPGCITFQYHPIATYTRLAIVSHKHCKNKIAVSANHWLRDYPSCVNLKNLVLVIKHFVGGK